MYMPINIQTNRYTNKQTNRPRDQHTNIQQINNQEIINLPTTYQRLIYYPTNRPKDRYSNGSIGVQLTDQQSNRKLQE